MPDPNIENRARVIESVISSGRPVSIRKRKWLDNYRAGRLKVYDHDTNKVVFYQPAPTEISLPTTPLTPTPVPTPVPPPARPRPFDPPPRPGLFQQAMEGLRVGSEVAPALLPSFMQRREGSQEQADRSRALIAQLLKTNPFSDEATVLRSQISAIHESRPLAEQFGPNVMDILPFAFAGKLIKGLRGGKAAAQPVVQAGLRTARGPGGQTFGSASEALEASARSQSGQAVVAPPIFQGAGRSFRTATEALDASAQAQRAAPQPTLPLRPTPLMDPSVPLRPALGPGGREFPSAGEALGASVRAQAGLPVTAPPIFRGAGQPFRTATEALDASTLAQKAPPQPTLGLPSRTATSPPPGPTRTGTALPVVTPAPSGNVLGLEPIIAGLSRADQLRNILRTTLNLFSRTKEFLPRNEFATAAVKYREKVLPNIKSSSTVVSAKIGNAVRQGFVRDKFGRISDLDGIDPQTPGGPTIADLMARLPTFLRHLTPEQIDIINVIRADFEPWRKLYDESGHFPGTRLDVSENGGSYFPRGRATEEGLDKPISRISRRFGLGGGTDAEKPSYFQSQAQGIEAGYQYADIDEVMLTFVRGAGERALDTHTANYFRTLASEAGDLMGKTPKELLFEKHPAIANEMEQLRRNYNRLRSLEVRLTERQERAIQSFLHDPTTGVDEVAAEWFRGGDFGILPQALRGPSAGATRAEVQRLIAQTRQQVRDIQPAYNRGMKHVLNLRDRGSIPLKELQGWSWVDEIAVVAHRGLEKERPSGKLNTAAENFRAFQALYRGMRATGEFSFAFIQGLFGIGGNPRAWNKALGLALESVKINGDEVLGRFMRESDTWAEFEGLPKIIEMTTRGLHQGGAETEFMLGQGPLKLIGELPVARQANRAWGYFGDILRIEWGKTLIREELSRGRTLDELRSSGDFNKLMNVANQLTGYSRFRAGGDLGELLVFAPRWLAARSTVMVKAVAGLRPGASIDQRIATKAVFSTIAVTMGTVEWVNLMLGNKTDRRPFIKIRNKLVWNSNFYSIRHEGRDYKPLGHVDSIARLITGIATGVPLDAMRGLGSGAVTLLWDWITEESFTGINPKENPEQWLYESFAPFAYVEGIPTAATTAATIARNPRGISEGIFTPGAATSNKDLQTFNAGVMSLFGEASGIKSMPVTAFEKHDEKFIHDKELNPQGISLVLAWPFQQEMSERKYPEIERKIVESRRGVFGKASLLWAQYNAEFDDKIKIQLSRLNKIVKGRLYTRADLLRAYFEGGAAAYNLKRGVNEALKLAFDPATYPEEAARQRWYDLTAKASEEGAFDADRLENLRANFESALLDQGPEGERLWQYVLANTNMRPIPNALYIRLPSKTQRRIQRSRQAREDYLKKLREGVVK